MTPDNVTLRRRPFLAFLVLVPALACGRGVDEPAADASGPALPSGAAAVEVMKADAASLLGKSEHAAQVIEVQHLLVSFRGSVPRSPITRPKEAAEALAAELYVRVRAGEDLDALVRQYDEESYPGILTLAASGAPAGAGQFVRSRSEVLAVVGDLGWRLAVGEVGVALHDPRTSPDGWHIVERTR